MKGLDSRTSRRRLLGYFATSAAAVGVLAVAGCGSSSPAAAPTTAPAAPAAAAPTTAPAAAAPTSAPAAAAPTTAPAAAATTAPAAATGSAPAAAALPQLPNITLKFLLWGSYKGQGVSQWVNDFTTATGAKVSLDQIPFDKLTDKVMVSLSGGTGEYDVATIDEGVLPSANPYLQPVQDYFAKDHFDTSDFLPTCLDAANWKGKQFDLPIDSNIQLLYYRTDVLDKAGIKEPPTKYSDMVTMAKKLQSPKEKLYGYLIVTDRSDSQLPVNVWNFLISWGDEIFDSGNKPAFDNQAGYDAMDFFKSMIPAVGAPGGIGEKYNDIITGLQQGQGIFCQNWVSTTATILDPKASKVIDKIGFALPLGEKVEASMRGIWTIGMTKAGKQHDASWEFIKWFTATPQQIKYALHKSGNPTRASAFKDPALLKALPYAKVHLETLQHHTKKRPLYPETNDIMNALGVMGSEIITGQKNSKDGIKDGVSKLTDIMKRGGYIK